MNFEGLASKCAIRDAEMTKSAAMAPSGKAYRSADPRGSIWRRWDPHIHAPGTKLADQYRGPDPWEEFLDAVERSTPRIEALGITDYWSLDCYETALEHKIQGRMPDVGCLFPNVEMRFATTTAKGAAVNMHLLISPEDPDHIAQARRFLGQLSFRYQNETYRCETQDLVRLGRKHDPGATDETKALRIGTNQFKITHEALERAWNDSDWAKQNILIGCVASSADGAAGLQSDASMSAVRREIERMAPVMFTSSPKQREFWLGRGVEDLESLTEHWGGRKLCLHGSDAHRASDVGRPALDRYTWIRGDASFESLTQACIEPESRGFVGPAPPGGALPYRTIESIEVTGAPWFHPGSVELNGGLVGIIGARGSGKTALADLVSVGTASHVHDNERSFISRALALLDGVEVHVRWADGTESTRGISDIGHETDEPQVQYLSQQFVERLCSADGGVTDELLGEIERVIFAAHERDQREGASTFAELRTLRTSRGRRSRSRHEDALVTIGRQISDERAKQIQLPPLLTAQRNTQRLLSEREQARSRLIVNDDGSKAARLQEITTAVESRQARLAALQRQQRTLLDLRDVVTDLRTRRIPEIQAELVREHADAGLSAADWKLFGLKFEGDVDSVISERLRRTEADSALLVGPDTPASEGAPAEARPYVADDAALDQVPLSALRLEARRLQASIGLDEAKNAKLRRLDAQISDSRSLLAEIAARVTDANGAEERITALLERRLVEYGGIFDAILDEEEQLADLYQPLAKVLTASEGIVGQLAFSVKRIVDLDGWAARGESLLDLRKNGPFKGQGALRDAAAELLLGAWERGSSGDVVSAMRTFREQHAQGLRDQARVSTSDVAEYWRWGVAVSDWLTNADHVRIRYGIEYDGVDVERLSPGTRGIVLLLLYLSIDQNDDRPLIIDQPEENLDPKSIFDELVGRFADTRMRRQVIIVTHNANLIVNTDVDQVIVAEAGPHRPGELPRLAYSTGGLENPAIRRDVCRILEGGEPAFKERARRLRVRLS